jgi:hypothetical protein
MFPSLTEICAARRLVGAGLLLAVFFLPLHFHFVTPTAHFSKDCSCTHGTRMQAGSVVTSLQWNPPSQATFIVVYEPQGFGSISVRSYAIRAPPPFTSL